MFKIKNDKRALFLLILSGLAIRVFCAGDDFLHSWDERYHALVAKHLIHHMLKPTLYENPLLHYDYKNWTANNVWLHKQPISLFLMAASIKIFGLSVFSVRIPSILASSISIYYVYYLSNYLYGRLVAFFSAFLCSVNGLLIELCAGRVATDHVDTIFLFFILSFAFLSIRYVKTKQFKFVLLAGIALGLALLTKWISAYFMILIFYIICTGHEDRAKILRNCFFLLIISLIVFLPWQLYIFKQFQLEAQWEYNFNKRHFTEVLEHHNGNYFFHFDVLRISYGELVYLPILYTTYLVIWKKNLNDILIVFWFWLPYLFYTFAATKMPAYTLISSPAVFIIIGKTYCDFCYLKIVNRQKARLLQIFLAFFWILPVRYCFERVKLFNVQEADETWNKQINNFILRNKLDEKTVVFSCPHPVELMFKSNCVCYEGIPDSVILNNIKKTYKIIIFNE